MHTQTARVRDDLLEFLARVDRTQNDDIDAVYEKKVVDDLIQTLKDTVERMDKMNTVQQDVDMLMRVFPAYTAKDAIRHVLFFQRNPHITRKTKKGS